MLRVMAMVLTFYLMGCIATGVCTTLIMKAHAPFSSMISSEESKKNELFACNLSCTINESNYATNFYITDAWLERKSELLFNVSLVPFLITTSVYSKSKGYYLCIKYDIKEECKGRVLMFSASKIGEYESLPSSSIGDLVCFSFEDIPEFPITIIVSDYRSKEVVAGFSVGK